MPSGGFLAELCHWRTSADDRLLFGQPRFAEAFEHVVEIRPKLIGLEFFPHPESERGLHSKSLGNGQLRLGDALHLSRAGSQIALAAWWPRGRALERDGRFRIAAEAIKRHSLICPIPVRWPWIQHHRSSERVDSLIRPAGVRLHHASLGKTVSIVRIQAC